MTSRFIATAAAVICGICVNSLANAAEGKESAAPVSLDAARKSSYSGAVADAKQSNTASAPKSTKAKSKAHLNSKAVSGKVARGAPQMATRAADFYFYGAWSTLLSDRDQDGYHAEFKVRFDADVNFGDAYVYARLYLRRAGERDWYLYRETDEFYINGQSPGDDYYVTTRLDDGYPTGEYDVLVDLYESGYGDIVATIGPLDSGALSYLPLEEAGLDIPADIPGYSIRSVSTNLFVDDDADGFYSSFSIAFDPDADFADRLVYARIWVRPRGGQWFEEFATEDFWVLAGTQSDRYVLDIDWYDGYPTSLYDVQIDLYDAASDLLLASAGSERPALAQIPLEDQRRDGFISAPTPGSGGNSSSREGGGGAMGLESMLGLLALGLVRGIRRLRSKPV